VIGAGQSGLAMSRRLSEFDHVVLERGEAANSWRTERWDSLRLLTPNWLTGLPGHEYVGDDSDGYMTMPEVVDTIAGYARAIDAPVREHTTVTRVSPLDGGYRVETDEGVWEADAVVLASGGCNLASVPVFAEGVPESILQITPLDYRSPDQLPDGGVLIVGASASGAQLADEIARSGRDVVVSAGEHVRMPRRYRGRDIFWWMDKAGILDERYDEVDDIVRARHTPSPQLIGTPDGRTVDLAALQGLGVRLVGRLGMVRDGRAQFSGGLKNTVRLADLKLGRLLDRFDEWAEGLGAVGLDAPERFDPTPVDAEPTLELDFARTGIRTIVWATGYRPDYSWLDVPGVIDYKGKLKHDGGVVLDAPGLYLLGTTLLRRRRSTYISGAAQDSAELAGHLAAHLAGRPAPSLS
jgi:putative flavoprotein involved in K+ transport